MYIITIDGPAGSGKTTIAKSVADKLKFKYVDTGAMYRAVTLKIIESGVKFSDIKEIEKIVIDIDIQISFSENQMNIYLDNKEVSNKIRNIKVTDNTSYIAAISVVREKLLHLQRKAAIEFKKVVFEGRDMGSVVFFDANLKIYLDAKIKERAKRRWQEEKNNGIMLDMEELKNKIYIRDKLDSERGLAPLIIPENAIVIDTTNMNISEVVEKITDNVEILL